jgi:MscS family membrane protein
MRLTLAGFLSIGLLLAAPPAAPDKDPLNRESPQSSVMAFLEAYHAHDYTRAAKYLDRRKLPAGERLKAGPERARQLGDILSRDSQFDVADLSRTPESDKELVDSFNLNGQNVDVELQRVTLRSNLSIWVFSQDTVERIPKLARMTSDSPVERYLPEPLTGWTFLDTALWKWIAMLLLAGAAALLSLLVSPLLLRLVTPVLKRIRPSADWSVVEGFVSPLQLLVAVAVFRAGMEWIDPALRIRPLLEHAVSLLAFLGLAWLSMRVVDVIIVRLNTFLRSKHRAFSYSVLPLAARVLKITILLLMLAALLTSWGYNTNTIVAGLGVGGIAIALAAQKTIENFFGGVAVVSDRPVAVGDFCKFGDRTGTVEDVGLRSTRIRTLDRTLVTVPNGQFSSMTLENFDRRDKMLFHFMLNVRRDTKPDQVRALLVSVDLEIFAYVKTKDGDEFMKIQQDLYLAILDAVEAAGTALALPTQANISYSVGGMAPPMQNRPGQAQEVSR